MRVGAKQQMPQLVGHGVCQEPGSGNIQSLRLFLDSIPKDIGNTRGHKSFAASIRLSRRLWENAEKKLSRIQNRRALWIQGRIFIIQGTVGPFDLDTCLAKDQAGSILRFTQNLPWQVSVVVDENRDPNPLFGSLRARPGGLGPGMVLEWATSFLRTVLNEPWAVVDRCLSLQLFDRPRPEDMKKLR